MKPLESPMNANERYLYQIAKRLEVIIELLDKQFNPVANQEEEVPVVVEEKPVKRRTKK